ncbi:MAG: ferrochelatase [Actinomycetia bacterium]|nr:ferrochelatase [Actinomycetes bacterium]MCP4959955.1 ferrochelatase [Actinomycetes bacterium]
MSFGGPEHPTDVMDFLRNVTRGRDVPAERLARVAEQYALFGGRSPINDQNRALLTALRTELDAHGITLPLYWGNRNWHPFIQDTVARMIDDGIERPLAFVTSPYSTYSSCRQYREDMSRACEATGATFEIDKIRSFWNHPGFIGPIAEAVRADLDSFEGDTTPRVVFVAHSLPASMAATCDYELQLDDTAQLVLEAIGHADADHDIVFQSRSGPPQVPWLEPDICDHLRRLAVEGIDRVLMVPLGFISDHMEVLYDLDTRAMAAANEVDIEMARSATPGTHPEFVAMIRELIEERLDHTHERRSLGHLVVRPDNCPPDCCPAPARR